MTTSMPPGWLEAYRRTRYRVDVEPPFRLSVDVPSAELAALMAQHGARSAAFVTAWNPFGVPSPEDENRGAQARLRDELDRAGLRVEPGFGEWPDDPEQGEPSFLVLGIDEGQARRLGERHRQNAILFAGDDARPRLILLSQKPSAQSGD